jgi:signal transduction histidine kinase
MIKVIGCITTQHDLRLVILAAIICALGCYTTLSVLARAQSADRQSINRWWLCAAAIVGGATVWTTHFVAMLAYQPGLVIGYDLWLTFLSIAIAVLVSLVAFVLALNFSAPVIGGIVFGAAIGAMHFTGMAALSVRAQFHWDWAYVLGSLVLGVSLGAAALPFFTSGVAARWRLTATTFMTLGIAALHFTAMTALTLEPDPFVSVSGHAILAPEWLAIVVTAVMVMIVVFGLLGSGIDQHLAQRALHEAERLRAHIIELERTRCELEATTADLHRAFEAAAAGSQAKSQFLATMSHELRTPLNAIIGFSEMMSGEVFGAHSNPRYKDYATSIQSSGQHLLELINDILDFSKIDAGRLELQDKSIDLSVTVNSAVQMMRGQAEGAGVSLYTAFATDLPDLRADERRVRQVLLNLLSNAVKFTPRGGEVRISVVRADGEIVISVSDTGIGIAPDDLPKALERFGQVDSSIARKYEGTGLGLPLSQRLMVLHGGTLEIASEVGIGTTVLITFPSNRIIKDRVAA